MTPYDAEYISLTLRKMPPERLATVQRVDFQRAPLQAITKGAIIEEMIAAEKQRRSR